jgi:CelD/BcsL family acetyltransferase involved in cellulose biosynthesis
VTLSTSPDTGCAKRIPSDIRPAWSQLAARRTPASIFLTPEWIGATRAHDLSEPVTLAAGELPYGVAALSRQADGTIGFAGGEFTDEQDIVAAPEDGRRAARAVAGWIANERAPRVLLEYVPGDSPTLDAFDEILTAHGYRVTRQKQVASPRIALPADFQQHVQSLGRKERHELRRKLHRFESVPGTSFRWASEAEGAIVLDRFLALHRLSKGPKAAFMTDRNERFFRDLADALAAVGWLRLGVLRAYDEDAAVLFGFAYRDTLALYNAAYDPALGSLSLGIASHAFALRDAIAQGFRTYDLLRGDEPYKYDLGGVDRWLWKLEAVRE